LKIGSKPKVELGGPRKYIVLKLADGYGPVIRVEPLFAKGPRGRPPMSRSDEAAARGFT